MKTRYLKKKIKTRENYGFRFQVSGVSPAAGLKNGQFNRNRIFGNVFSFKGLNRK
jgi:hypothetical protein